MSFLESLLRRSYEKIEDKKGGWCATPSSPKLQKRKGAGTVKQATPYDFLLGPVSANEETDEPESGGSQIRP